MHGSAISHKELSRQNKAAQWRLDGLRTKSQMAMENVHVYFSTSEVKNQVKNQQICVPSRRDDRNHLCAGYALLRGALDEFQQVYRKDSVLAHAVRVIGAIEDTLYEYVNSKKEA